MELSELYQEHECISIQDLHRKWPKFPLSDIEKLINSHELQAYKRVDTLSTEDGFLRIVKIDCRVKYTVDPIEGTMIWREENGVELYADIPDCVCDLDHQLECPYDGLYFIMKDIIKIEQKYSKHVEIHTDEDEKSVIAKLKLEIERLQKKIAELEKSPSYDNANNGGKGWQEEYPMCAVVASLHSQQKTRDEIRFILSEPPYHLTDLHIGLLTQKEVYKKSPSALKKEVQRSKELVRKR